MVSLNLSSDDVRNCKETATFVKECEKIMDCKKKEFLKLMHKKGILFKKSKEPEKLKEVYKKMEQVKVPELSEK